MTNRIIKFKVWNRNKRQFVDFDKLSFTGGAFWAYKIEGKDKLVATDITSELVEFTGLLDKNGKEIYEGDIVHMSWMTTITNPEKMYEVELKMERNEFDKMGEYSDAINDCEERVRQELITPIIFEDGCFQGIRPEDQRILFYHKIKEWDVEVIGNIYENENLLTK